MSASAKSSGRAVPNESSRSVGELVSESFRHMGAILRAEVRLAKAEIREEGRVAVRSAAMGAVAALFGALGVSFLLWAVFWALATEAPAWLAALGTGVFALVIGALVGWTAYRSFQRIRPPERTQSTIKENLEWAKRRLS